jgi:hypothetical protein
MVKQTQSCLEELKKEEGWDWLVIKFENPAAANK